MLEPPLTVGAPPMRNPGSAPRDSQRDGMRIKTLQLHLLRHISDKTVSVFSHKEACISWVSFDIPSRDLSLIIGRP